MRTLAYAAAPDNCTHILTASERPCLGRERLVLLVQFLVLCLELSELLSRHVFEISLVDHKERRLP